MGECLCGVDGFDHSATCPACTDYDPTVVIVEIDDWTVMYVNGKKKLEGHSIPLSDIADAVGNKLEVRSLYDTPFEESLYDGDTAPDDLSEVPNA